MTGSDPRFAREFDPNDMCWSEHGWENAGYGSVQDARTTSAGQARAAFAEETGALYVEVHAWKRHILPLPGWPNIREDAIWKFVRRGTPGSYVVWVCGTGSPPPKGTGVPWSESPFGAVEVGYDRP